MGTAGPGDARIVFVGEAPGRDEVTRGEPFIGRAGQVLWKHATEAGIARSEVFVVNALACRPPRVRPTVAAISACRNRLVNHLESSAPRVVVALGATALRTVTGEQDLKISVERGIRRETPWGPLVPTWHPAWILRRPSHGIELVGDLQTASNLADVL